MASSLENRDIRTTTFSNNLSPIRSHQMCSGSHRSVCTLLSALGFNLHDLQPSIVLFKRAETTCGMLRHERLERSGVDKRASADEPNASTVRRSAIQSMIGVSVSPGTTNGTWDLIAEIRAKSLADFDRVLREVRTMDGVLIALTIHVGRRGRLLLACPACVQRFRASPTRVDAPPADVPKTVSSTRRQYASTTLVSLADSPLVACISGPKPDSVAVRLTII